MELRVHPAAERELDAALSWCTQHYGQRASTRLRLQFERAGTLLMSHPEIGSPAPTLARQLPLRRYPFTLIYRVDGTVIHLLAVMHQRRQAGYWTERG
ncbi:type II toxin-antitoxin system RelE/ParE family toxin [Paucibacter sp. XJ19-41]|uniref:type II toxin-antitoxin system RelE/ParE family toxin n=1 Tax=Paucibacter sp. XJ19-41 TaxID=2927824 RepID=UPI0023490D51|nr:type II toxin-antitoxin system RelE/ParE family toxin [Paucibacter sp. XJ19-41]MDC6168599.1 type II toxin-antitoxin system RelE/ParE family toxin [Paucibacter sp. XJ19-41]